MEKEEKIVVAGIAGIGVIGIGIAVLRENAKKRRRQKAEARKRELSLAVARQAAERVMYESENDYNGCRTKEDAMYDYEFFRIVLWNFGG